MSKFEARKTALYLLIALGIAILPFCQRILATRKPSLVDDAYYYLVVARSIAHRGVSDYYHGVLTNGYHPLWEGLVSLLVLIGGPTLKLDIALGMSLGAATVFVVLYYLRPTSILSALCVAFLLWISFEACDAFKGMESGLVMFLGTWGFSALFLSSSRNSRTLAFATILLILATAARLDFAIFTLLAIALAPGYRVRQKLFAIASFTAVGALYALINLQIFATAFPVSGAIKALGGLQFNHRFLWQIIGDTPSSPMHLLQVFYVPAMTSGIVAISLLIGAVAIAIHRGWFSTSPERAALLLAVTCVTASIIYLARIAFFSSWQTWPWYNYFCVILLLSGFVYVRTFIGVRLKNTYQKIFLIAGLLILANQYFHDQFDRLPGANYEELNQEFVSQNRAVLSSMNIAMGDRSGSLAYDLGNERVVQLEGLMMNRNFFSHLQSRADLKPYLCHLGVNTILAYEPPLGRYRTVRIEAMRPELTQYQGAYVTVSREQQIFSFRNNRVFPQSVYSNNVLYGWRLDCPPGS